MPTSHTEPLKFTPQHFKRKAMKSTYYYNWSETFCIVSTMFK